MKLYYATFGHTSARGGTIITGQQFINAKHEEQARMMASYLCDQGDRLIELEYIHTPSADF